MFISFFFFNDTSTTEIYTLSLHDALPIYAAQSTRRLPDRTRKRALHLSIQRSSSSASLHRRVPENPVCKDRKSTRLNSSHSQISYAVFCLKKKKTNMNINQSILSRYLIS